MGKDQKQVKKGRKMNGVERNEDTEEKTREQTRRLTDPEGRWVWGKAKELRSTNG